MAKALFPQKPPVIWFELTGLQTSDAVVKIKVETKRDVKKSFSIRIISFHIMTSISLNKFIYYHYEISLMMQI